MRDAPSELRETRRWKRAQQRKKRKMAVVMRDPKGGDCVGLGDAPTWGCEPAGSSSTRDEETKKLRWCGRGLTEEASGRRKVEERGMIREAQGHMRAEWLEGSGRGGIRWYTSIFEDTDRGVWRRFAQRVDVQ